MERIILTAKGTYVNGREVTGSFDEIAEDFGLATLRNFGTVFYQLNGTVITQILQSKSIMQCAICPVLYEDNGEYIPYTEVKDDATELVEKCNSLIDEMRSGISVKGQAYMSNLSIFSHMAIRWIEHAAKNGWLQKIKGDISFKNGFTAEEICFEPYYTGTDNKLHAVLGALDYEQFTQCQLATIDNTLPGIDVKQYVEVDAAMHKRLCTIQHIATYEDVIEYTFSCPCNSDRAVDMIGDIAGSTDCTKELQIAMIANKKDDYTTFYKDYSEFEL